MPNHQASHKVTNHGLARVEDKQPYSPSIACVVEHHVPLTTAQWPKAPLRILTVLQVYGFGMLLELLQYSSQGPLPKLEVVASQRLQQKAVDPPADRYPAFFQADNAPVAIYFLHLLSQRQPQKKMVVVRKLYLELKSCTRPDEELCLNRVCFDFRNLGDSGHLCLLGYT